VRERERESRTPRPERKRPAGPPTDLPGPQAPERRLRITRRVVLAAIAAVYLISLSPRWLPGNDSAVYRLLGRSLARGQGYVALGSPHVKVPPGFPLLLAGTEKLGLSERGLNAVIMALAGAAIVLAYLIVREHIRPEATLWITLLAALSNHMHDASMQVLSDIPCLVLVGLGLWGYVRWSRTGRGRPELATFALVAAMWVRLAVLPLAIGAGLGLLIQPVRRSRRRAILNGLVLLACLAASFALYHARYEAVSNNANVSSYANRWKVFGQRGLATLLVTYVRNFYETGKTISRLFTSQRLPGPLALAALWIPIIVGMILRLRRGHRICVLATASYLGALMVFQPPRARYLLPVGFLLILYFVDALEALLGLWPRIRPAIPRVTGVSLILLSVANLPRDFRRIWWVHQERDQFLRLYRDGREGLYETSEWLRRNAGPDDRFVSSTNAYTLAILSGARGLHVSGRLLRTHREQTDPIWALFDREGITLVVFQPSDQPEAFTNLRDQGQRRGWLKRLYGNDSYEVWRYRRPAPTTQAGIRDS